MAGAGCLPCKVNLRLISNHQPRHLGVTRSRFSEVSQWFPSRLRWLRFSVRWPGFRVGCELLHNTHRMWCLRVWYLIHLNSNRYQPSFDSVTTQVTRQETVTVGVWIDAGSRFETKDDSAGFHSIYFTIDQRNHSIFSVEALAFEGLLFQVGQFDTGEQWHCPLSGAHGLQRHQKAEPNPVGAGPWAWNWQCVQDGKGWKYKIVRWILWHLWCLVYLIEVGWSWLNFFWMSMFMRRLKTWEGIWMPTLLGSKLSCWLDWTQPLPRCQPTVKGQQAVAFSLLTVADIGQ